jgi:DNA-binding phage protein
MSPMTDAELDVFLSKSGNAISRFDAAEFLGTPEARMEYLRAAIETQDTAFILDTVGMLCRSDAKHQCPT